MGTHSFIQRTFQAGLCSVALLGATGVARAESPHKKGKSDEEVCQSAYKSAQERQQSGDLVAASELYGKCSSEVCGSDLWQACVTQELQLNTEVPSVVLIVSDHNGDPLVDVQVKMDGRLLTSRLNGLAFPVNPGTHEFAFATENEAFSPQKITVGVGDRNRLISAAGQVKASQPQVEARAQL